MINTTNLGNIGQANIIAKFVSLNVPVYIPFCEGYKADMIADFNGKLNKIQIKTTEKIHEDSYMIWSIACQQGFHGNKTKYTSQEVDYFALYCIENGIMCLVPFDDTLGKRIQIRLDSYTGNRSKNMHFVSDFTFETIIKT